MYKGWVFDVGVTVLSGVACIGYAAVLGEQDWGTLAIGVAGGMVIGMSATSASWYHRSRPQRQQWHAVRVNRVTGEREPLPFIRFCSPAEALQWCVGTALSPDGDVYFEFEKAP